MVLSFFLCMGTMIAFPQSSGHFFPSYILLHRVCIISTEHCSPSLIISAVMLSSPGAFLFFWLFIASSISPLSMWPSLSWLLFCGISSKTVMSVGFSSLYSSSKCSLHRPLISSLSSIFFPSLLLISDDPLLTVPHISSAILNNPLVSCLSALCSISCLLYTSDAADE